MKPTTVFLGEMTNLEVEAFLREHDTVIVPTGSTEQHGPHGPLLTDVLVPTEVARRIAPVVGAAVAPSINYGLSYPHDGFTGVVRLRIPTFEALVEDVCVSLATVGFNPQSQPLWSRPAQLRPRSSGSPTMRRSTPMMVARSSSSS